MYHKVIAVGRLGGDPDLKYTSNGTAVCSFSLATDVGWGDNKKTVWFRVSAWDKLADVCNQYLAKGRQVLVEGELSEAKPWQARDGEWRASLNLTARNVTFLGSKGDVQEAASEDADELLDSEEIPF